jgi:hypothetical protein
MRRNELVTTLTAFASWDDMTTSMTLHSYCPTLRYVSGRSASTKLWNAQIAELAEELVSQNFTIFFNGKLVNGR